MKLEFGSIRQKAPGGPFYYRYQVNGQRKEIPLRTCNREEAERKASELVPVTKAKSVEVVAAHVKAAKGFAKKALDLPLSEVWEKYSVHPDRAMPHTVSEQLSYQSTFQDFVDFVTNPLAAKDRKKKHTVIRSITEITSEVAEEYAAHLREMSQAVDTHNRKIKRIRKILEVMKEYSGGQNPFHVRSLLRSGREEQDTIVRRQAFSREQEQALLRELENPNRRLMNKAEIRVVYHIGMFTGQRLKDCVLMQWQNVDLERRQIFVKQFKTGKEVTIPIAPELYAALQEALAWKVDAYVCPKTAARYNQTNEAGKNVGNNLVDLDVLRVIRWIGVEPSVSIPGRTKKVTVYGFHSLRHSFASFCAAANVSKAALLSILGTDSEIADKYYTHVGDAAQQQAIAAISSTMSDVSSPQERIRKALELLESNPPGSRKTLEKLHSILKD